MSKLDEIDENLPEVEAANIINEVLLAHKDKWGGDDEIQDMVAEAFVRGIKYWQENKEDRHYLQLFMQIIDEQYELSLVDLELLEHQQGRGLVPVLSKKSLKRAVKEKMKNEPANS